MNSTPLPAEFHWNTEGPANGISGEGLANKLIDIVKRVDGVRTICDLGCGNGYLSGRLASLGYEVTGIDASRTGLEIVRRSYPSVSVVAATIDKKLNARLGKSDFDLIISSDVIEHLYRPAALVETALTLLKPRGQLIVGTPYHGYLKNLVIAVAGKMDTHFSALHDGGHIKFFSVKTLTQLLKSYSFTDLRFAFYGRAPFLWKNMICSARKGE